MFAKPDISRIYNTRNLQFIVSFLSKYEIPYMIFYGTLLGLMRENNIIENDDDIDILIEKEYFSRIVDLFGEKNINIAMKEDNIFIQLKYKYNEIITSIDLYFYERDEERKIIIDKWNFNGHPEQQSWHLYIPMEYIYPLKITSFVGCNVLIPNNPMEVIKFLYGERFMQKLKKGSDYVTKIKNNRPYIIYSNEFALRKY